MHEDLTDRFAEFFEAVWQQRPFAWQQALAERVLSNDNSPWPQAVALPTAAGKTACIDIAVFALAAQANRLGTDRAITAPRRIFFVVDRRVIVDEAFDRAGQLARRLKQTDNPVVKRVADNLRVLARGPGVHTGVEPDPLQAFELRGGMYRSEAWARSPIQPLVVASTVDQFGSRLLFRAYGRGSGMWPVYAGLTGNDSLVLLDEAHCAKPFLQTLRAVSRYRTWADAPLPASFFPVVLSATPPDETATDTFRDESTQATDPAHPLGQRQLAHKPARLIASKASGKTAWKTLAKDLTAQALELATGPRWAIVIFANRVATARETHRLLKEFCAKHGGRCLLVTGRMRPLDRDHVLDNELSILGARTAHERSLTERVFVVATQTLEVGADLDFDGLVTECAAFDALRQRFGRLNRMGRAIEGTDAEGCPLGAEAVIVARQDQADTDDDDPVYGKAIGATWAEMNGSASTDGVIDFGIAHLDVDALMADQGSALVAPAQDAPVMLPSHLDAWVQTSPEPLPAPDVSLFLHGPERGAPDVRVCWRADIALDTDHRIDCAVDTLTLCPPSAAESLPVPIGLMRRWLNGDADARDESSDIEGTSADDNNAPADHQHPTPRLVLRWFGRRQGSKPAQIVKAGSDLRPGDIIVIPANSGQHEDLGDFPQHRDRADKLDCGDEANLRGRAKALLRLHPALIDAWPDNAPKVAFKRLLDDADELLDDDPDQLGADLRQLIADLAQQEPEPGWRWLRDAADHFATLKTRELRRALLRHPDTGLVLRGTKPLPAYTGEAEIFTDEDDASASGTLRVPLLPMPGDDAADPPAHLPGVAQYARRFATGCQLGKPLIKAIERAGLLHDIGKADPRFQALLHGGNPYAGGALLAKSAELPQTRQGYEQARAAAGYPQGGRHELLSVRLAESAADALLPPKTDPLHSMILHLVASHHGYCRPFAPVVDDPSLTTVCVSLNGQTLTYSGPTNLERLDSGVAERFWQQVRRYGWWGSAWLESLLRLADHRRSEAEERQ